MLLREDLVTRGCKVLLVNVVVNRDNRSFSELEIWIEFEVTYYRSAKTHKSNVHRWIHVSSVCIHVNAYLLFRLYFVWFRALNNVFEACQERKQTLEGHIAVDNFAVWLFQQIKTYIKVTTCVWPWHYTHTFPYKIIFK